MEFSRQEYWSRLPYPTPGDLPNPRIKLASPESPAWQADSLPLHNLGKRKWNSFSRVRLFVTPCPSPGQNIGGGSLSLLQGIFPTQGLNPVLPHCRWILYQLSHKGSPGILEWVAYPFSRGSSWPRNRTGVSCIVCRFFTNWAIREACATWQAPGKRLLD